jgi:hypothetical protein
VPNVDPGLVRCSALTPWVISPVTVAPEAPVPVKVTFARPEVEDFGVAALGHENIGRFDVSMNDAFGVRGVQGIGNLNRQSEQNIGIDGPSIDAVLPVSCHPEIPWR